MRFQNGAPRFPSSYYFAGVAAAGAGAGVELEGEPVVAAFLCFFTCCFWVVVVEVVPLAGVCAPCAAKDRLAAASVSESPRIVAVIFVMVLYTFLYIQALTLRFRFY